MCLRVDTDIEEEEEALAPAEFVSSVKVPGKCMCARVHSVATDVFWLKSRLVCFRFGAKMTEASSKIDVRRLKVGELLIQILVHCALLDLVSLVLGWSRSASQ